MSIGIGCPPGAERCNISGKPDPHSGTIDAKAQLLDSHGKLRGEARYRITEDFIDYAQSQMPEGLYLDWLPRNLGGTQPTQAMKQQSQVNFQHHIQTFFCNHAFAYLVLGKLATGQDVDRTFDTNALETAFAFSDDPPNHDDFIARLQKLSATAHGTELLKELASLHIALFYGVTLPSAEAFLARLMKQGLIEKCCKKTGYKVPYGDRNADTVLSCIELTKEGLSYKTSAPQTVRCFVVMPFAGLDSTYKVIESAWRTVFGEAPIIRQDKDPDGGGSRLIDEKILVNIDSASVVIADLSLGEREQEAYTALSTDLRARFAPLNPNVMFEVGYAIRCAQDDDQREIFLIAQNPACQFLQSRVFDLRNRAIHSYESSDDGLRALHATLVDFLAHKKGNASKLEK